jgi:predicted AAA+ superfamily ATPase
MVIERDARNRISELAKYYPVTALTGARQSGKTTLLRHMFPERGYFNLESPDVLALAESDPRAFVGGRRDLIIDEIQRAPELLSYIQAAVDEDRVNGRFMLSGSQNLLLSASIDQSLAGRAAYVELTPLSRTEMEASKIIGRESVYESIFAGGYPGQRTGEIPPEIFFDQYIATYVERDVRSIMNIANLAQFRRFMALLAGRIGQLLDYISIANDTGVSAGTVRNWLSILEASFLIRILQPYHNNFGKRYIKSPKIYFSDTGLACRLLGIRRAEDLERHFAIGGLFENYVIVEALKHIVNYGLGARMFFYRDSNKNEVDLIIENGAGRIPVEIKSSSSFSRSFLKGLSHWRALAAARNGEDAAARDGEGVSKAFLVYTGEPFSSGDFDILSYEDISPLFRALDARRK